MVNINLRDTYVAEDDEPTIKFTKTIRQKDVDRFTNTNSVVDNSQVMDYSHIEDEEYKSDGVKLSLPRKPKSFQAPTSLLLPLPVKVLSP